MTSMVKLMHKREQTARFAVLYWLTTWPDELTIKELHHFTGLSKVRTGVAVSQLEREGLVEKRIEMDPRHEHRYLNVWYKFKARA